MSSCKCLSGATETSGRSLVPLKRALAASLARSLLVRLQMATDLRWRCSKADWFSRLVEIYSAIQIAKSRNTFINLIHSLSNWKQSAAKQSWVTPSHWLFISLVLSYQVVLLTSKYTKLRKSSEENWVQSSVWVEPIRHLNLMGELRVGKRGLLVSKVPTTIME